MYVNTLEKVEKKKVQTHGAQNVSKQRVIGPEHGWDGWVMRVFTIEKEGYTPKHAHPWPHINYIIGGKGVLSLGSARHNVQKGSVAYIPEGIEHQFINEGDSEFSFMCIVPEEGDV